MRRAGPPWAVSVGTSLVRGGSDAFRRTPVRSTSASAFKVLALCLNAVVAAVCVFIRLSLRVLSNAVEEFRKEDDRTQERFIAEARTHRLGNPNQQRLPDMLGGLP